MIQIVRMNYYEPNHEQKINHYSEMLPHGDEYELTPLVPQQASENNQRSNILNIVTL